MNIVFMTVLSKVIIIHLHANLKIDLPCFLSQVLVTYIKICHFTSYIFICYEIVIYNNRGKDVFSMKSCFLSYQVWMFISQNLSILQVATFFMLITIFTFSWQSRYPYITTKYVSLWCQIDAKLFSYIHFTVIPID